MKKYFSIGLLFVYFFSIVEWGQFFKIPFLIEHFYHHQNEHQGGGFSSFMVNHYSGESHHDQDDEEDQKLPFKSLASDFFKITACPCSEGLIKQIPLFEELDASLNSFYKPFIFTTFLASIWHPPKLVHELFAT